MSTLFDRVLELDWDETYGGIQYGAWFRVLDRRSNELSSAKSTAGGKCDYHTNGACCDVIGVLSLKSL